MSERNSTAAGKPSKPSPDFPLLPHASGQWATKTRDKMHYFGKWDDPEAALDSYEKQPGTGVTRSCSRQQRFANDLQPVLLHKLDETVRFAQGML